MHLSRSVVDGCRVLAVHGEVEALTVPRLEAALRAAIAEQRGARVVLDLTHVRFLASSGLKLLAAMALEGERQGEPLHIVVDETRPVIRPIQIAGLEARLALFHTVAEAVSHQA